MKINITPVTQHYHHTSNTTLLSPQWHHTITTPVTSHYHHTSDTTLPPHQWHHTITTPVTPHQTTLPRHQWHHTRPHYHHTSDTTLSPHYHHTSYTTPDHTTITPVTPHYHHTSDTTPDHTTTTPVTPHYHHTSDTTLYTPTNIPLMQSGSRLSFSHEMCMYGKLIISIELIITNTIYLWCPSTNYIRILVNLSYLKIIKINVKISYMWFAIPPWSLVCFWHGKNYTKLISRNKR